MAGESPNIAIVGATGAVGEELLSVLAERGVEAGAVRALASARSAGAELSFGGRTLRVEEAGERAFEGVDIAFFCASGEVSRRLAPAAVRSGAWVIDNSSAFRMDEGVPLVVPEVNPEAMEAVRGSPSIIANPNCSTIILLVAATPLRRAFGVRRMVVSTYQAVSGAGAPAMRELIERTRRAASGKVDEAPGAVFREPCAFNVFSHDSAVDPATGENVEERKMVEETRKIWDDPRASVSVTCVRVPVLRAHAESVHVTLARGTTETDVRDALAAAPGVKVVDDRAASDFPTSLKATGRDEVLVGRIRPDLGATAGGPGSGGGRHEAFWMLIAADQLRKGAALNAVQIAELLTDRS